MYAVLNHGSYLPWYSRGKRVLAGTGSEGTAILVYVIGERRLINKASLRVPKCCSLNSLYLTLVAELNDTTASKYFSPPTLLKDKYSTWKREMQIWEMATSLDKTKRAPIVFLSLEGKAREAILREMLERKEIAEISWVPTNTQIADSLTKKGVPSFKILGFISELYLFSLDVEVHVFIFPKTHTCSIGKWNKITQLIQ